VLADLARHPATARHIALKLARHFIADEPPADAVERISKAFRNSDGDLPTVYRAVLDAPAAWIAPAVKFKNAARARRVEFRMLDFVPAEPRQIAAPFELLGQRPYTPGSPAGWPDTATQWDGADALLKRIEWAGAIAGRVAGARSRSASASARWVLRSTSAREWRSRARRARNKASRCCSRVRSFNADEIAHDHRRIRWWSSRSERCAMLPRLRVRRCRDRRALRARDLAGALDGLAAVPAYGDGSYAAKRGALAITAPQLKLDGMFALHPSLTHLHERFQSRELIVFHAVASPYRERSHFDGQDCSRNGTARRRLRTTAG
jgi:hypothetical protein